VAALATPALAAESGPFAGATWLHHRWLQGTDEPGLDRLATRLGELGVTIVFPNVAHGSAEPIPGEDGRLGWAPRPDHGRAFVAGLRARLPGVRVIPYKGYIGCSWLADPARRAVQVDAMVATVEALGADGFQLDMECSTIDGRDAEPFRALLAEIAAALGPERTFSVAIPIVSQHAEDFPEDSYGDAPWLEFQTSLENPRGSSCQPQVFDAVFEHADQVTIMVYDTWYRRAQVDQYEHLIAGQSWIGAWYAARHGTPEFLPGIRFSVHEESKPDGGVYHRHEVENPTTAWQGISSVLDQPVGEGTTVRDHITGLAAFRLDLELAPGQPSEIGQTYLDGLRDALLAAGAVPTPLHRPGEQPTNKPMPDPLGE
jgi:hypothetical protein